MRLDADHDHVSVGSLLGNGWARRIIWVLALAASSATCAKTWVLGPTDGAGGAGGAIFGGGAAGAAAGGAPGFGGFQGFGGRTDPGTGGHSGSACGMGKLSFDIPTPEMTFLVGRNKSMSTAFGDSTRMLAVQAALNQVVTANQLAVNFGYQGFPSLTGCGSDNTCCPATDPPAYPGSGNANAIASGLRFCGAGQPLMNGCVAQNNSRSVSQAFSAMMSTPPSDMGGDRYVVLILDGPPGCESDDLDKACTTVQMTVSTLNRLSVKTYVVAIGDTAASDPCLMQIALAGGTMVSSFPVTDPTSLTSTLTQIVDAAAQPSCTIELSQQPGDKGLVSVLFQGCEVQFDGNDANQNGWDFAPGSKVLIDVHGSACKSLQMLPPTDVTVQYGCPPRTTPNNACP